MMLQNKNLEIKIMQLQFQEQKSELCLFLHSNKQNELYNLIESLEEKYKTLLTATLESQQNKNTLWYIYLWTYMQISFISYCSQILIL